MRLQVLGWRLVLSQAVLVVSLQEGADAQRLEGQCEPQEEELNQGKQHHQRKARADRKGTECLGHTVIPAEGSCAPTSTAGGGNAHLPWLSVPDNGNHLSLLHTPAHTLQPNLSSAALANSDTKMLRSSHASEEENSPFMRLKPKLSAART